MKITSEKIEIAPQEMVRWDDIKTLRLLNDKLFFVLKNGKVLEFSHLHPAMVEQVFRFYEKYLWDHPELIKRARKR